MARITEIQLQNFVLDFENKVVAFLEKAGFVRNKYNVFDILNIKRQELRHSDFLAFLLNPARSDEIGRQFLQAFLSILAKENPELKLDFFKIFYGNFESVTVKREYKNIDILLDVQLSGKDYIFVIENKVDSGEQFYEDKEIKGQLEKYQKIISVEYRSHTPIFLFLSPDKRQPSEKDWKAIDYKLIYSALSMVNTDLADNTLKALITDYKKLIRGQFKMETDKKLKEAALKIYNANADIFNFIFENLPNRVKETAEIIREFISSLDWVKLESQRQNAFINFSVNEISNLRADLQIFFQINVNDLSITAYMLGGGEQDRIRLGVSRKGTSATLAKYEWLVDNNKEKTSQIIDRFNAYLLESDIGSIKAILTDLLNNAFGQEGYVYKHSKRIYALLSDNQ